MKRSVPRIKTGRETPAISHPPCSAVEPPPFFMGKVSKDLAIERIVTDVRETGAFCQAALNSLSDHIAILDRFGVILFVNKAWQRYAQENDASLHDTGPGVNYLEVCRRSARAGEDVAERVSNGIQAVLDGSREKYSCEYPCDSPTERQFFLMNTTPLQRPEGGAVIVHKNITDRVLAKEALLRSDEQYRAIVEDQTDLICRYLLDGTLVYVNEAYCRYFGKSRAEFLGKSFIPLFLAEEQDFVKGEISSLSVQQPYATYEHRVLLYTGELRWIQWTDRAIFNAQGGITGYQSVGRDITERKFAEEELRNSLDEIQRLKDKLQLEAEYLRSEIKISQRCEEIAGQSSAIIEVLKMVEQVAPTNSTVLICGETGTGKELVAHAIHNQSPRSGKLMVKVNCASLPSSLVESELFGREKGAYTGALTRQIGRFELADNSTIFLDEIAELSLELQAKLLRVLQEGEFERLGSPKTIQVDVRVIAATNRNLFEEVKKGNFREDLYYRLNVFPITVPPLRERREDIPLLVWTFINEFGEKMGKKINRIAKRDMTALQSYTWPGNIRELRNVIEHAVIISSRDDLNVRMPNSSREDMASLVTLEEAESRHILHVLRHSDWRIKGQGGAAELLGMNPSTLYSKMLRLKIPSRHIKDEISS